MHHACRIIKQFYYGLDIGHQLFSTHVHAAEVLANFSIISSWNYTRRQINQDRMIFGD